MQDDRGAAAGAYHFEGLDSLNGTTFPDALLDKVMANLTGAEFKVLAYIVRRTFGFKKGSDTISLEQICNGVRRGDGRTIDAGTGLSKKTAIAALRGLEEKGVILAQRRVSKEKGNLPTAFAVRLKDASGFYGLGSGIVLEASEPRQAVPQMPAPSAPVNRSTP